MADETKKYVDLTALDHYDNKIKALIDQKDAAALQGAKDYADGLATNYESAGAAATVKSDLEAKITAEETRAKAEESKNATAAAAAQTKAEKAEGDAATAQAAADAAQDAVDALEAYVGTIPESATAENVVAYVDEKTAGIATDASLSALTTRVTTAEGAIDAIEADYLKAADKATLESSIAAAKKAGDDAQADIDAFMAAAEVGDAAVDTLKEIQAYITSDGQAAAEMTTNIAANAQAIEDLEGVVGTIPTEGVTATNVVDYAEELVAAEKTRAEGIENGLATRLAAVETELGDGEGSVADQIATAVNAEKALREAADSKHTTDIAAAKSAAENAQADVDSLETVVAGKAAQADLDAVSGRVTTAEGKVTALEGKAHEHENKTVLDGITAQLIANWNEAKTKAHEHSNKDVLDGITSTKVSNWDAAESNAKAYTDAEIAKFTPVTTGEIDALFA